MKAFALLELDTAFSPRLVKKAVETFFKIHLPKQSMFKKVWEITTEADLDARPVPESVQGEELRLVWKALVSLRNSCLEAADFHNAVVLSHLIAAVSTGAIRQVGEYKPSAD